MSEHVKCKQATIDVPIEQKTAVNILKAKPIFNVYS